MGQNPNEIRALRILSTDLDREVRPWPGKKMVTREMARLRVRRPVGRNDAPELMEEDVRPFWGCLCPDGYFIESRGSANINHWNKRCHHLCWVEVEHTSAMSPEKVRRLGEIWLSFDSSDAWEFHVIIIDNYDQWRELDLWKLFSRRSILHELSNEC